MEIVIIAVSDLAPALPFLVVIIISIYSFGEKNIYVGKVYNKNMKKITFIIMMPGYTILWNNETEQHLF